MIGDSILRLMSLERLNCSKNQKVVNKLAYYIVTSNNIQCPTGKRPHPNLYLMTSNMNNEKRKMGFLIM